MKNEICHCKRVGGLFLRELHKLSQFLCTSSPRFYRVVHLFCNMLLLTLKSCAFKFCDLKLHHSLSTSFKANKRLFQTGYVTMYRVTHLVDSNLLLTLKQKFRFGLARSGQDRPVRNFCSDVNGRFESRRCVTLYSAYRIV